MPMRKVRSDDKGVFVSVNGNKYRPGPVVGYSHAYCMDQGPILVGEVIRVNHVAQSPLARILVNVGTKTLSFYWHMEHK